MGLDISVYRQARLDPTATLDSEGWPTGDGHTLVHASSIDFTEENWPGRTGGLKPGVYAFADSDGFRAGSYGGYNQWRSWLATVAGWKNAEDCWNSAKTEGPFFELIHFADNEGYIGAEVSKKLAEDFAKHQGEAERLATDDPFYLEKYKAWRAAFEMAADSGFVEFH